MLGKDLMHGFFYARGVNTYWHQLLEKDLHLLKASPHILEMDLASCFKNINKTKLLKILDEEYHLPRKVIGIIDHFINLKVPVSGLHYPSSASYAESLHNTTDSREHMGIFRRTTDKPMACERYDTQLF